MDYSLSDLICESENELDVWTKRVMSWDDFYVNTKNNSYVANVGNTNKDADTYLNELEWQCTDSNKASCVKQTDVSHLKKGESKAEDMPYALSDLMRSSEKEGSNHVVSDQLSNDKMVTHLYKNPGNTMNELLQLSDKYCPTLDNTAVNSNSLDILNCRNSLKSTYNFKTRYKGDNQSHVSVGKPTQLRTAETPKPHTNIFKDESDQPKNSLVQSFNRNTNEEVLSLANYREIHTHSKDNSQETSKPEDIVQTDECPELSEGNEYGMAIVPLTPKKRKRKREEAISPNDPFPVVLPPCRVCNERASGFHYGANTCEACKGFFRRTLVKKKVFFPCRCVNGEKGAWKLGPVRNGCPACRYDRCLLVGMNKNAIKIGRYTLIRRTENIKEVKTLETIETLCRDVMHDEAMATARDSRNIQTSLEQPFDNLVPSPSYHVTKFDIEPPMKIKIAEIPEVTWPNGEQLDENTDLTHEGVDEMVAALQEAKRKHFRHSCCFKNKDERVARIKRRHDECYESYKLKTAIFGEMKPLSKREHLEIYKATGIDIDDRFEDIRGALQFFERRVRVLIDFAKAIPGFTGLDLEDQVSLIKGSRVQSSFIGCYGRFLLHYNMDLQVAAVPWGKAYHLTELTKIYPLEFIMMKFHLAREMEALGLTQGEEMVMRAIAITLGDHCQLQEPDKVREINSMLLRSLKHLLTKRLGEGGFDVLLQNVYDMFAKLRHLKELDNKVSKELFLDWPLLSNNHLLVEFIS